ncbi:MAG: polyprenyl diphosphate synthase [Planctomycetes bacterium]|nr:polyprenyl diphosphate synthase [Planctomycetota bacterium]
MARADAGNGGRRKSVPIWPTLKPPVPRAAMPRHVAIIMDGNGRWARQRGLVRIRGHEAGVEAVRDVVRYCGQTHVQALTLYAFSTENWQRPRKEVQYLMRLLKRYLVEELDELHANKVRLTSIGGVHRLPGDVLSCLEKAQTHTAGNSGLTLCLALSYGSHEELLDAARDLSAQAARGDLAPERIDAAAVEAALHSAGIPPVDLLIRTAGERRVSNFLLWQACDAFFHVTDTCWPNFRRADVAEAIHALAAAPSDVEPR